MNDGLNTHVGKRVNKQELDYIEKRVNNTGSSN